MCAGGAGGSDRLTRNPEEFAAVGFLLYPTLAQRTPAASGVREQTVVAHNASASWLSDQDVPPSHYRSASGSAGRR